MERQNKDKVEEESWGKRTSTVTRAALSSTSTPCNSSSGCQQAMGGFTASPEIQTPLRVTALFCEAWTSSRSAMLFQCTVITQNHLALTAHTKNPLQPLKDGEQPQRTFAQKWNINPSSPLLLVITVKTKTPQQESWYLIKTP